MKSNTDDDEFLKLYAKRLGLPESYLLDDVVTKPDHSLLCDLQERHLARIPFDNLGQHGGKGGPVTLDLEKIAHKILQRHRGGFCMELNSLFAMLLEKCGFAVTIVQATVSQGTFDGVAPSHVCLIVKIQESCYYVDVGFGEPPLHPLKIEFHTEQITPEGMQSRLIPDQDGNVIMEWYKDGSWQPRLRWSLPGVNDASLSLSDMTPLLQQVSKEDSKFAKKLVVCRLTRDQKFTVSGNTYKVTGSPRFSPQDNDSCVPIQTTEGLDPQQIQEILWNQYGMPVEETATLQFEKSNRVEAVNIWSAW
jgi:N-hydroxyarylamine O-acetyltransferase